MQTEVLRTDTGRLLQIDAQEYLEALEALALEVDKAMDALVTRALPSFEESVVRQKASCTRLADLAKRSSLRRSQDPAGASPIDAELADRISVAASTLHSLNRSYSALLKHSGDTIRQIAGLFQNYTGPKQQTAVVRVNVHTWSCEL